MKKIFILLTILCFIGCNDGTIPSHTKLKVYEDAKISEVYPYVADGDSFVFHHNYISEDDENIADDEFSEDFLLEIDITNGEFVLSTSDLQALTHVYRQYCFCGFVNSSRIIDGALTGSKTSSDDWMLEGELTLELGFHEENSQDTTWYFERELDLSGLFISSEIPKNR